MEKIEIYSASVCPFAQRTLILLNEKNIDYQLIEIDLDNKPDWFIKISPYGKVPLIKHNNQYIYESSIINEYLEEIFPQPSFLSHDATIRAFMRIWIAYCNSEFIPVYYKLLLTQEKDKYPKLRNSLMESLYYIEKEGFGKFCKNRDYFFGENISLVDISFYPFFERFVTNEYYRDIKIPDDCHCIRKWILTMRERPAVKPTANPPEFYIERYGGFAAGDSRRVGYKKILDDLWK
jgi:glutathione S-transferase